MLKILSLRALLASSCLLFLLFFFFPQNTFAQVFINEFSSASNPEWVELYNQGDTDAPLSGWTLFFQDNISTSQKKIFESGDFVPAHGYKVFERPYTGTQAWLSNSGDTIILKDQNLVEIDSVRYGSATNAIVGSPSENQSAGRSPDGGSSWIIFDTKTQSATNITSTPTPTPIPSTTPTPTPTPSPTPSPTPRPATPKPSTPKPTATPIATSVSVSLAQKDKEITTSSVLSESSPSSKLEVKKSTPSPKPKTIVASENNLQKILIGAGILLVISSAILAFRSFITAKRDPVSQEKI